LQTNSNLKGWVPVANNAKSVKNDFIGWNTVLNNCSPLETWASPLLPLPLVIGHFASLVATDFLPLETEL
jgi:hypothetical protein